MSFTRCASRYRGRTTAPVGTVFGHEQTGQIVEAGVGVHRVKVGDIVSIPFNVACGCCVNCKERKTNLCLAVNPLKVRPPVTQTRERCTAAYC